MKRFLAKLSVRCAVIAFFVSAVQANGSGNALDEAFQNPPFQARLRAYWWWLNGNVTKEAITKDLEWMKQIGMGGGLVFDAGGATQGGHASVPTGPLFGSPEWRALFTHALKEADRLGLELGLNIQSGWNLGGPMVTPDKAAKVMTWSETVVTGPAKIDTVLVKPKSSGRVNFYRDTFVLAFLQKDGPPHAPIRQLKEKSAFKELGGSATDCTPLLEDIPATPGEEATRTGEVLDLTGMFDAKSDRLLWEAPEGKWVVLRFGYTNNGHAVSTASGAWKGLVLDYLDADALRWYWHEVVDPIITDAGPLCGKSWKMVQTDSWELGGVNWTARLPEEFQKRRGYELRPWLPVIAGRIVNSREASNKFLADFRRTMADCVADNHYGTMAALARKHGMGIQPESAGPHTASLDGLMCYGRSAWPMSEFWVPSPHRPTDGARFFVKQAASAAHIYGQPVVCAEGFTSIGPQWNDTLWNMQKPSFDHEACAGLNLVFWHAFTCSPKEMGMPGQEYFAGTHFNPQITWAKQAPAFVSYLNRSQALLQRGRFVGDVLYYYGNHVPNIARLKQDDPAKILPEYDYDVINEEVLLTASCKEGRIQLPSGMSYRILVLPKPKLSEAVQRKVDALAAAGARITTPEKAKAELCAMGIAPDVEGIPDWIHRTDGDADIYFLSNQQAKPFRGNVTFRVAGKQPEIWDAVTGTRRDVPAFTQSAGRTTVPLEFPEYGSLFVLFRKTVTGDGKGENFPPLETLQEIAGSWEVAYRDAHVTMEKLADWTTLPGMRFLSGTATYRLKFPALRKAFDGPVYLDLGGLSMLAEVSLNGKNLGVVWCPPWRVEIPQALQATNLLEIAVVNGWWNQLAGDPEHRQTQTNIRLKPGTKPVPSGLFGPVVLRCLQTPSRPNILFLFGDDWAWPHASCLGAPGIRTPTFDRLAKEGVLFRNAHVVAPSCSPSRAGVLTGQWPWRLEEGANLHGFIPAKFDVYPDLLQRAGYFIGVTGKGYGPGSNPGRKHNAAGPAFKTFTAFLAARPKDRPFCFWFGSHEPHRPYKAGSGQRAGIDPSKVFVPPYLPDSAVTRGDICDYYAEAQQFDQQCAVLLAELEKTGELDNTLIVMSGDNGWPFPRSKATCYDSGTHQPLVIRWGARVKGGRSVEDVVSLSDLAPTFLEAAGLKAPTAMTARSLMPVLLSDKSGQVDPARDHTLTGMERHARNSRSDGAQMNVGYPMRTLITKDFHYIRNFKPERWPAGDPGGLPSFEKIASDTYAAFPDCDAGPTKAFLLTHRDEAAFMPLAERSFGKRPARELYDLRNDPYELKNVAEDPAYSDTVKALDARLMTELKASGDPRATNDGCEFDHSPGQAGAK